MSENGSRERQHSLRPAFWVLMAAVVITGIVFLVLSGKSSLPAKSASIKTTLASDIATHPAPTASPAVPTSTPEAPNCLMKTATPTPLVGFIGEPGVAPRWFVGFGANPVQETVAWAVDDDFRKFYKTQYPFGFQVEVVPHDAAKDTLITEIASGNGPDIIGPVGWADANGLSGQWMDLTSLVKDNKYNTSQIDPALLEMSRNEQRLLGLPFALYPAALEWNAALFEKAGLQPPPTKLGERYTLPDGSQVAWDWATLAKVAQLLTLDADGRNATQSGFDPSQIVQYGFSWGHENHPALTASFWQAASLLAPGGSPGNYRAVIPAVWRASWQWTYDGMHGPRPFISLDADSFENSKAAMTIETTRYFSSFGRVKSFQFAPLPGYQGQVSRRLEVETFRFWKGSYYRNEDFQVMSYLLDQGVHKLLVECNGFPPAYDALPVRSSDQQAFLEVRKRQFPWVNTWDTLLAGAKNPETPADEGNLPNFPQAWSRLAAFGARLEGSAGLDLPAEESALERDLTNLFNKNP